MLYGYDSFVNDFKRLADNNELSHAYLFFGENSVGKFSHAMGLASYLESGVFDVPEKELRETMIVEFGDKQNPEDEDKNQESIGIEKVRILERFLYQTPVFSKYRVVILRDAQWLTGEAQSALLKTLEGPPENSLIIATTSDPGAFYPPVASRFFKVFFPVLSGGQILDFIHKYGKIEPENEERVIKESFGRIGRVITLLDKNKAREEMKNLVKSLLKKGFGFGQADIVLDDLLKKIAKTPIALDIFFEELEIELIKDKEKNSLHIAKTIETISVMNLLNTNKRIQLKNLLYSLID